MYRPLGTFLLRAPLLPERALGDAARAFARSPLHAGALALASPATAAAGPSRALDRTLDRYGRRAAFRATPQGLLAGVALGRLAARTRVATGTPTAHLAPTWQELAALGRALLDEPDVRTRARVRVAPSLARGTATVRWLGPGDPFEEPREAALDARLVAVLDAASRWTPWADARRAGGARARGSDDETLALDDWLLLLVDEGLLHTDLTPPLVGPPPAVWMRARLDGLERAHEAATLARAIAALDAGDLAEGRRHLEALPVATTTPAIHGVLVHRPRRTPTLARAAVERAATLAPLLFRLQEALAPPAGERLAQPAVDDALDAATEIHGAGAFELAALDAGDYGVSLDEPDARSRAAPPPAAVLAVLVDAVVAAARARRPEATLDVAALTAAFADTGAAPPPSCELFLAPAREPRGARAGTGWLLGLHAPAGASWGRFAAALGAPLARALDALGAAEREARPWHEALDVSFAPAPALADLCTHPRARGRALALTAWTDADEADGTRADLTPSALELVASPGAMTPLALRVAAGGAPVVPSPLARVRSTTAPAGATRLLCGWSLTRQHAPWALALGPLGDLPHVPRLVLDGFVVAPASWRLPAAWRDARPARAAVARWRRAVGATRFVQVGHADQLLAVDLDAPRAADDLGAHERAWEIWPPLGRAVDRDGRRVEAVVALVDRPDADEAAAESHAARTTRAAGRVPPPRRAPPLLDWTTHKIFGAAEHADALLLDALRPALAAARRAREIKAWFFLRYVDGPGRRHHLRVRARVAGPRGAAAWDARLARALAPARAAGAVVTVETADYHPERARWGAALAAVHAVFQSCSEAALALLAEEDARDDGAPDRVEQVVRALDALARGLVGDRGARHALARARRLAADAEAALDDDARAATDAELRRRARRLRVQLAAGADDDDPVGSITSRALRTHARQTARAVRGLAADARTALAPALLHLACVRLAGADAELERRAYTFWERTLEGLLRAPPLARPAAATRGFRRARRQAT
jgi:thiopeptide-type bacteriocin biosynthesis protein